MLDLSYRKKELLPFATKYHGSSYGDRTTLSGRWAIQVIKSLLPALIFVTATAQLLPSATLPTGPAIGATIPAFSAPDQNGNPQTLKTIAGPKGAMLVFYRSADW